MLPAPQSSRQWFLKGFVDALGLPAVMISATMCGIGGLVRDIGLPVWAGTLSTIFIWAGPAQVLLIAGLAAGASLPATAFAIALSSSRFLPMTVSVLPLVRGGGRGMPTMLFAAHFVSMTTWVEGLRRLPAVPEAARYPYFLGFSLLVISIATVMTHIGFYLYALLPAYLVAAFLFTTPLFFTAAMAAGARKIGDWIALASGLLATPLVAPLLPPGVDFLLIGLVGGTLAYVVGKRRGQGSVAP